MNACRCENFCVKLYTYDTSTRLIVLQSNNYNNHEMERLLLFHLDLAHACTGASLDENASEEELLEAVLLYIHNDGDNNQEWSTTGAPPTSMMSRRRRGDDDSTRRKDMVSFLGLCTALYQLPASLQSCCGISSRSPGADEDVKNNGDDDSIITVQLTDGRALVFVPLEQEDTKILAVAQISTARARLGKWSPTLLSAARRRRAPTAAADGTECRVDTVLVRGRASQPTAIATRSQCCCTPLHISRNGSIVQLTRKTAKVRPRSSEF
jgi:hypothetical protein